MELHRVPISDRYPVLQGCYLLGGNGIGWSAAGWLRADQRTHNSYSTATCLDSALSHKPISTTNVRLIDVTLTLKCRDLKIYTAIGLDNNFCMFAGRSARLAGAAARWMKCEEVGGRVCYWNTTPRYDGIDYAWYHH